MSKTRVTRNTSAGIVAGIAGYASYWHQVHVALMAGERVELAHILPGSVDGLLAAMSIAMVDARSEGRKPSIWVYVGFWAGIAASVGANVMSAQPTALGRIVAAWPSVSLFLVVEGLARKGRKLRADELEAPAAAIPPVVAQPPAQPAVVEPVISVAELDSPDLPQAPTSPAVAPAPTAPSRKRGGKRDPYGPREGDEYSERHGRRLRNGR